MIKWTKTKLYRSLSDKPVEGLECRSGYVVINVFTDGGYHVACDALQTYRPLDAKTEDEAKEEAVRKVFQVVSTLYKDTEVLFAELINPTEEGLR